MLQVRCKELTSDFVKGKKHCREFESITSTLKIEKLQLQLQNECKREAFAESEERFAKLLTQKSDLEHQVNIFNNFTFLIKV